MSRSGFRCVPRVRIDSTRFAGASAFLDRLYGPALKKRIDKNLREICPDIVHAVLHGSDDWQAAAEYCERTGTPLIVSLHDDLRYNIGAKAYSRVKEHVKRAWNHASWIFTITEELGIEYCRRFGKRQFQTLTDGVDCKPAYGDAREVGSQINVYFCGLLHYGYTQNFVGLLKVLDGLHPRGKLTLRGAVPFREMRAFEANYELLPFSLSIDEDFNSADVLYLPLQFGEDYTDFVRFSLSTKMVTYLVSGVPILFHGPKDSALGRLLSQSKAAICCFDNDVRSLRCALDVASDRQARCDVVRAAQALAIEKFDLTTQRRAFADVVHRLADSSVRPSVLH